MSIRISTNLMVPVAVQGELVSANRMLTLALAAVIRKYGTDGVLSLTNREAAELVQGQESIDLNYNFATDAMELRVR